MEEIEIVKEFNEKNRYRDGGKINNAIAKVIDYAEKYLNSINTMNCQENHTLNKGIDELIEKYQTKYDYDNSEYSLPSADYFCFIQDLKKLKGE